MIPDRYRAALDVLDEVSKLPTFDSALGRETVGKMALAIASFIVDSTTSDHGDTLPEAPGLRDDFLLERLQGLEARLSTLELAMTETNRRITPADERLPEATKTIFTIPVVLAEGVDDERIRDEIAKLPVGLDGPRVVDELVKLGLVERAR